MSDSKPTDSPLKSSSGAESPTTVRPLDMDDDDVQEAATPNVDAPNISSAPRSGAGEDAPPPKPPRPLSPQKQAEITLREAFPSVDLAVIKAVLVASGGNVEPAFNALLGMTDPEATVEQIPPRQPPRPSHTQMGSTTQSQLEADEVYARQLAEHYEGAGVYGRHRSTRETGASARRGRQRGSDLKPNEMYDEGHSFLDDDLPVIKENLRKGFLETQKTVNSWINTIKKKIDGEDDDSHVQSYQGPGQPQNSGRMGRRSGDYNRYDADPEVLGDDFANIQLDDNVPPHRSARPLANPDLFKPTPGAPRSSDGRKTSFHNGGSNDTNIYQSSPRAPVRDTIPTTKPSKWQPLATVDPNPVGDIEHDPFSLADSEDEKESKSRVGGRKARTGSNEGLLAGMEPAKHE